MDENVRDILLILLGATASLLGTATTIFFEFRRERLAIRREKQSREMEQMITYLFNLSQYYGVLINYFITRNVGLETPLKQAFDKVSSRLEQSPLYGLPPQLITRDEFIRDRLVEIYNYFDEVNLVVRMLFNGGFKADAEFVDKHIEQSTKTVRLIDDIIQRLEKKLI